MHLPITRIDRIEKVTRRDVIQQLEEQGFFHGVLVGSNVLACDILMNERKGYAIYVTTIEEFDERYREHNRYRRDTRNADGAMTRIYKVI